MTAPVEISEATGVRRSRWHLVVVAIAAASVDLLSKVIASRVLVERDVQLPGPLDLSLAHNSGVAFSLGVGVPPWVLVVLAAGIATVVAAAAWKGQLASGVAAGLVIGGAAANIVDRLEGGTVVDMLHTGWWPTFNLADVWIVTGCALLVLAETATASRQTRGVEAADHHLVEGADEP